MGLGPLEVGTLRSGIWNDDYIIWQQFSNRLFWILKLFYQDKLYSQRQNQMHINYFYLGNFIGFLLIYDHPCF